MFTGLVEEVSKVRNVSKSSLGARLCIEASFCSEMKVGDSISVNGACQTVVSLQKETFEIEVMNETLRLTNLTDSKYVNLERSMKADGRFDGHFVSGHIDGTAAFASIKTDGFSKVMRFEYPAEEIILKGSICVNGVSLTVSAVEDNYFEVSIIPHTLENTNLGLLREGEMVNIETDMIAKYMHKYTTSLLSGVRSAKVSNISESFLKEHGF